MDAWWVNLLQILLPMALVVLMAYLMLKQLTRHFMDIKHTDLHRERSEMTKQTKRLAYERLAVYLERMSFPDLLMRVNQGDMETYTLYSSLLLTIQKEFEHNIAQQIYISDQLWDIIRLSKHELTNLITTTYHDHQDGDTSTYVQALLKAYAGWDPHAIEAAKKAVRKEAALVI